MNEPDSNPRKFYDAVIEYLKQAGYSADKAHGNKEDGHRLLYQVEGLLTSACALNPQSCAKTYIKEVVSQVESESCQPRTNVPVWNSERTCQELRSAGFPDGYLD